MFVKKKLVLRLLKSQLGLLGSFVVNMSASYYKAMAVVLRYHYIDYEARSSPRRRTAVDGNNVIPQ